MGSKTIHEELMSTLGDDAYGLSHIKMFVEVQNRGSFMQ
jgi:hypothetical protein